MTAFPVMKPVTRVICFLTGRGFALALKGGASYAAIESPHPVNGNRMGQGQHRRQVNNHETTEWTKASSATVDCGEYSSGSEAGAA